MMPNEPTTSRRGYLGAAGGLVIGAGSAGCVNAMAGRDLTDVDDFEHEITVELQGDGPGDPVALNLHVNGNDFERTIQPGEELETRPPEFGDDGELKVEYDETLEAEVEWSRPGLTLDFDLNQEVWDRSVADVRISLADDELTTDLDVALTLPESTTEMTGSDTRTVRAGREYELDIDVSVGEDEMGAELEVEWEDEGDDEDHGDEEDEDENDEDEPEEDGSSDDERDDDDQDDEEDEDEDEDNDEDDDDGSGDPDDSDDD